MPRRRPRLLLPPAFFAAVLTVILTAAQTLPLRADTAMVFGPNPRALDNRSAFAPEAAPVWAALRAAGLLEIVLNSSFLMQSDFQRGPNAGGDYPARPQGSYLENSDLRGLAALQQNLDLQISYEAGIGLSGESCNAALDPVARGQQAARREFSQTLQRLKKVGIAVSALNVDGPFLRLIAGSRKGWSCAQSGAGFDIATTVTAVQAYLKTLRDLVAAANPDRRVPVLRLVINLPNWQLRGLPPQGRAGGVDLVDVLGAFAQRQAADPHPVVISELVIDYPYALVQKNPALFRDRSKHLWNASRRINAAAGAGPEFGYITNTLSFANACLDHEPRPDIAFLPYLHAGQPISVACQVAQTGDNAPPDGRDDSDADYLRDSLAYAAALRPSGALAQQLVTQDGTRIADHIAHFYMQSWGINPLRNLWLAEHLPRALWDG